MAATPDFSVTSDDPEVCAAIRSLQGELLRYGARASALIDTLTRDPACGLAHAHVAMLHMFTLTRTGIARAQPYLAAARAAAAHGTPHEQHVIAAVDSWSRNEIDTSIAHLDAALLLAPRDLIAAKLLHYHLLNSGRFEAMLASARRLCLANADVSHVRGMLAFALDQCGYAADAEREGHAAATAGCDPWAVHAVAHALDTRGAVAEGQAWMQARSRDWEQCSSFMFTHNWWHTALFELDRGNADAALALYDSSIWGVRKDYAQDQINAVALLARLQLRGIDVGDRWNDIAAYLRDGRTSDHLNGFLDLHYVLALSNAGLDSERAAMLATLTEAARAERGRGPLGTTLLVARAIIAHASGDFDRAATVFDQTSAQIRCIGGSHTQRDLFELLRLDAHLRSADRRMALHLLDRRVRRTPEIGWFRSLHASLAGDAQAAVQRLS